MPSFSFHKTERLKSRKIIAGLFKDGRSFSVYPLRIVWKETRLPQPGVLAQFALTVPKRSFPKATRRNRIKRLIREAYRLNKHILYKKIIDLEKDRQGEARQYAVMVIYIAKETLPYPSIEQATQKWIGLLSRKLKKGKKAD